MAKVPMKRIEIITLLTDGKSVIERLQRRGVVDIMQYQGEDGQQKIEKVSTEQSVQIFEKNASIIDQAITVLDGYSPEKKSLLSAFEPRAAVTTEQFGEMALKAEESIRISNDIISLSQKIKENRASLKANNQYRASLESWRELEVPMRFKGTGLTAAFIGTLPGAWDRETLLESLKPDPETPLPAEVQIVYSYSEQSGIFVLCHKDYKDECSKSLRELGFALPSVITGKPPAQVIQEYEQKAQQLEDEIVRLTADIIDKADQRQQLLFTLDYLSMRADKYRALENLALTNSTMIINGYIPAEKADALANELQNKYIASVTVSQPTRDEEPPVAFKNAMPAAAIEDITESYDMPSKTDVDPNPVMAFFYYAFFGLMLSDAGYGLLMALATGFILKFKKPEGNTRRNMQKFFICGLSTIFWGALFGSWFGDIVRVVSSTFFGKEVILGPIWFDPVTQPMKLLVFSLILGFIQVVVGLGVKFYMLWREGKRLDAIFDVGFWWILFAGIILLILPMVITTSIPLGTIGKAVALIGVAGLLITGGRDSPSIVGKIFGGLGGLYGITGYFSDILSYCRLMALGLVTGIIGSVVNSIGSMMGDGILGAVMLGVVFIFGHLVNFGINALGAYVHCNRLQYVEFFSKFYEGGGRLFKPFNVNTKHYKFKEEH
ncbi:MAG: V-type ATP synthase subunit I [Oscillospiraceae bacterium]|nr:V-type ATP synthase subunit I [Oscillospiraceae bacterium]MDD4414574.1 V-type ATP synthase subunit I [Oscillospiraceae bacterium]